MKKIIFNIIKVIIILVSISLSIYLFKNVNDLDMIPNKYITIFIIVLILVNILIILGLITKKIILNIISIILSICLIGLSLFGIKHTTKITNIIEKAFSNNKLEITNYSVVVIKNSEFNEMNDLEGKKIGYVILDIDKEDYISKIKLNIDAELIQYNDSYTLYRALFKKEVDAILLNDIYFDFLRSEDRQVKDKTRTIFNIEAENEIIISNEKIEELKPINILISGSDSRTEKLASRVRSDVNMIVTINPNTREILLTSIPRDTYVQLHGTTGVKDKLTHSGIYGLDVTKKTIEDFLDIKIDYTFKLGFTYTVKVIDLLGGVDIYSEKSFTTYNKDGGAVRTKINKGMNHLNGAQALSYARERYAYSNGDNHRIQNQQQVLEAIMNKLFTNKEVLTNYEEILNSLTELYLTDMPDDLVKKLVKNQLEDMSSWKIEKQQISVRGQSRTPTYSMPGWKLYVAIPNESSVNKCSNMIKGMIEGNDLNTLKNNTITKK